MTANSNEGPLHRYFAFIRAINTGGRRLTNDQLMEPFRRLGFSDVAAYQAAGNITFVSDAAESVAADRLESAASEAYGFDAPVFVRSRAELIAVNEAQPFSDQELEASEGRVQVAFMATTPPSGSVAEALELVPDEERVVFADREWFWLPKRGISDSLLPVTAIERLVGPMTIRTLGTISRMLRKYG